MDNRPFGRPWACQKESTMTKPEFSLDELLGNLFRPPRKPKSKADPDYGKFRRLCKKHGLTYTVADDGYVDVDAPDGARFTVGTGYWDERLGRLEEILETGYYDNELAWPAKATDDNQ
jgi:hypothetical protein